MVQSKSADKHLPHIVDRYQQLFADWGSPVETGLEFHFPQEAHAQLAEQLPDDFICIAFGAKFRTKQIPESLVIELIKGCKSEIVLLGGAAEVKQAEEILEGLDSPSRQGTQNWVGRCSLEESAFILSRSRKLLAADTGMLHMATALGIPSATLWGNTVPEFGMAAYYGTDASEKATHFEVPGLSCRPCSKLGKSSCPKGHWNCMMQQDKVAILGWLNATNSASEATF
jgi:ADP-heptose:LPS heptosyltransferase